VQLSLGKAARAPDTNTPACLLATVSIFLRGNPDNRQWPQAFQSLRRWSETQPLTGPPDRPPDRPVKYTRNKIYPVPKAIDPPPILWRTRSWSFPSRVRVTGWRCPPRPSYLALDFALVDVEGFGGRGGGEREASLGRPGSAGSPTPTSPSP